MFSYYQCTCHEMCCAVHSSCLWGKCPSEPGWGFRKHNSTQTQLLAMFCQMPAIICSRLISEALSVSFLFVPVFLKFYLQKVLRKHLHGHYYGYKHWIKETHKFTRTCTHHHQAWKSSSQLSASKDPSLAARVRSMNMSLTSCSHTAHTSASYIMYLVHSEAHSFSIPSNSLHTFHPIPCVHLLRLWMGHCCG